MTQPNNSTVSSAAFEASDFEITIFGLGDSDHRTAWEALVCGKRVPKRRQRKPSIGRMIAAAERGGKTVTSITTPDGVTLHFGKVEDTEASNPWLAGIDDKITKQ